LEVDGPAKATTPPKVFVKSFGCQMNVYDSRRMADVLCADGYVETSQIEDADLVILNTCHIRERASEKVYSELGKAREVKQARQAAGRATMLAVAGCVAQAEGSEILRRQKAVDLVVGPQNYHRLPELLMRAATSPGIVANDFSVDSKFDHLPAPAANAVRLRGVSAFVTIQEGCDKFCSFCVVPYTRGAESSRPAASVLAEVESLARGGVREITLLGQNVNAYKGKGPSGDVDLPTLTEMVARIPGIARVRYTTSHPADMSEALIAAHRNNPALAPYLHLPIQSGSNRVLNEMNRKHDAQDYLRIVDRVRDARPDIALSSDFIVGFPGESESDFQATLDLVERVKFASSFSFKYSARPGTPGADFSDQVEESIKGARLAILQGLLESQRQEFNRGCRGRVLSVLFEKPGRRPGQVIGRSPYLQSVCCDGDERLIGSLVDVEITGLGPNALRGRIAGEARWREMPMETVI
jgi:tRNA-2-methylthio-N6-dimethylallyladenosine synthase